MQERNVFSFPGDIWALSQSYRPDILHAFFRHLLESEERFRQAVQAIQWFPVGFHGLHVAMLYDDNGDMVASVQINLYHPAYAGNEHEHAHARDAMTFWYAPPGTYQRIRRSMILAPDARRIKGVSAEERALVMNCLIDLGDGRRPGYHPVHLGTRWVASLSKSFVADQGFQWFSSIEVHDIGFEAEHMGVSVHSKGSEEARGLNTPNGLINYKGLSPREARKLKRRLPAGNTVRTVVLPPVDFRMEDFGRKPSAPTFEVGSMLLNKAHSMLERLV